MSKRITLIALSKEIHSKIEAARVLQVALPRRAGPWPRSHQGTSCRGQIAFINSMSLSGSGLVERCFSLETDSAILHFQIIDLGQQLYVWLSSGDAKLSNMSLAINSRFDQSPSVANVLPSHASSMSESLAQRLGEKSNQILISVLIIIHAQSAMRLKRPVIASCNLPANAPILQALAEKRLIAELLLMEKEKIVPS